MIVTALVSAALGCACGWLVRSSADSTRVRVLDELYSRKLRLADQQREESVKAMSQARVESAGYAARFENLEAEFAELRARTAHAEAAETNALDRLELREAEFGRCRAAAEEHARASRLAACFRDDAEGRAASAAHAVDQAYDELMGLQSRLAAGEHLLAESQARCAEQALALAQRDGSVEDAHAARAQLLVDLESKAARIAGLEREVEAARGSLTELAGLREVLAEREAELEQRAVRIRGQAERIDALAPRAARSLELEQEHAALTARSEELAARLALALQAEAQLAARCDEFDGVRARAAEQEGELARERERARGLEARFAARGEELCAAQRDVARLREELGAAQDGAASRARAAERQLARVATLEAALAERDGRIKVLTPTARPKQARATPRNGPPRRNAGAGTADDLKRIAGIGPVLARKLRRLGVESFEQLAALTRTEIDALGKQLGIGADRIRREGWISSARVALRSRDGG